MKFKRSTPPMQLVEFVKNNTFSEVQLGIPIGYRYIMDPRMGYGFLYNDEVVGPHYLPYASYLAYKECFKVLEWLDGYGRPITYKQAIQKQIMVHREILSHLYKELTYIRS
jgi:hypothetical protein